METVKDLNFYKKNCQEDLANTPVSVLRYITELEEATQLNKKIEVNTSFLPEWLTDEMVLKVKNLWNSTREWNYNPRTTAVKYIREVANNNGYEIDIKKSAEIIKEHCL